MIFIDTNVLIDIVDSDPIWADWSQGHLEVAAATDDLAINDVVYAELAIGYRAVEDVDALVQRWELVLVPMPRPALFVAAKAYQRYRAAGGIRTGVLPDFFIGAQALVAHAELITRDVARYRTYFPALTLISPGIN
jgi:predicted nucleic acid-binding protein